MKKFLIAFLLSLVVSFAFIRDSRAQFIGGPHNVSCAAGFTALAPNYCQVATLPTLTNIATTGACIQIPSPLPSSQLIKALVIDFTVNIKSSGVVNTQNSLTFDSWFSGSCTIVKLVEHIWSADELVAATAGTLLEADNVVDTHRIAPCPTGACGVSVTATVAGGASTIGYRVMGYYSF